MQRKKVFVNPNEKNDFTIILFIVVASGVSSIVERKGQVIILYSYIIMGYFENFNGLRINFATMARLLMRPTEAITLTADAPTLLQPKVGLPYANLTGSSSTLDAESATFSVPRSERNPRPAVRN